MNFEEILKAISNPIVLNHLVCTYKPVLYNALEVLFSMYKDLINNDDYFNTVAQGNWKRYKALVDSGFTEDQAMAIILDAKSELKEYAKKTSGVSIKLNN